MKSETTAVIIMSGSMNAYSTIVRSCINAMNACAKLQDADHVVEFQKLKHWAEQCHDEAVLKQAKDGAPCNG